jgi:hypothetical protein
MPLRFTRHSALVSIFRNQKNNRKEKSVLYEDESRREYDGVGEKVEDLQTFNKKEFVDSLFRRH